MNDLLNPANYELTSNFFVTAANPTLKNLQIDINLSLESEGKIYLNKVELQIPRECASVKYFMNITMLNMYSLISGTKSFDNIQNIGE